ncbi:tetratricopeptide repeat protein [Nitrospirota bacterium]
MILHSMTDFNLHVGANGLFFFFLLGLTVSASSTGMRGGIRTSLPLFAGSARYAALAITLVIGGYSLWFNSGALRASAEYSKFSEQIANADASLSFTDDRNAIERAVALDGFNPVYRVKLAALQADAFEFDQALLSIKTALRHNPLCGTCLQSMAVFYDMAGEEDKARKYLEASLRYGARWTDKYLRYAKWLSGTGDRDEALRVFEMGMKAEPQRFALYIEAMTGEGYSVREIYGVLPQRHEWMITLAREAIASDDTDLAGSLLDSAFGLISNSDAARALDYNLIYILNKKAGRQEHSYYVASEGAERFQDNANILIAYGRELERRGELQSAIDAYRDVLMLQPSNLSATRGLERLAR